LARRRNSLRNYVVESLICAKLAQSGTPVRCNLDATSARRRSGSRRDAAADLEKPD